MECFPALFEPYQCSPAAEPQPVRRLGGDVAISKYLITNAQFERFVQHSNGYINPSWWEYSAQAIQCRQTHKKAFEKEPEKYLPNTAQMGADEGSA